jgi:hypothetical protein
LEVQLKSFKDLFQLDLHPKTEKMKGLYQVFLENFPITDTRNNFVLEFLDYYIDPPRIHIQECIERGLSYSVPLKAKLKLYCTDPEHEDFDTVVQDVYLGTIPYMTDKGTLLSMVLKELLFHSCTDLRVYSSVKVFMPMVPNCIPPDYSLLKVHGLNLLQTLIM